MTRIRVVAVLAGAAFSSWLLTFAHECYYQGWGRAHERQPREAAPPYPGAALANVFWLLQISDIHVSSRNDMAVLPDFASFCSETVPLVQPALVLATGDLTHAKFADERHSQQFEEEWQAYAGVLERTGVTRRTPWLDLRGNHDVFDVPGHAHRSNWFKQYARSWRDHHSYSFSYTHHTSFGDYAFLALDACPQPGPRRPYNFFGILHEEDLASLRSLVSSVQGHNHTLWFSHYPSCAITADHAALRRLMAQAVAHVCGHFHRVVSRMYGRHPGGHLELELGDFKDNRIIRLIAFDHDLFSFVDTRLGAWPLVLITNPKDAHFAVPSREPLGRMRLSTHVRLLAFSPSPITSVSVSVDGQPLPHDTVVNDGPLYSFPWQPEQYASGLHVIGVSVSDASGRESVTNQSFSLDGTVPLLQLLPQLLVLTDIRSLLQASFLFVWLSLLAMLVLAWAGSGGKQAQAQSGSFFLPLVRRPGIFFPLLASILYLGTGPWYVGEVMTGIYGLVFVHGVAVAGHFLPGSMTYLTGAIMLVFFFIPLTCYLAHLLATPTPSRSGGVKLCPLLCTLLFFTAFLLQLGLILGSTAYGTVAVVISPGITWPTLLSLVLVFRALRIRYQLRRRTALCVVAGIAGGALSVFMLLYSAT